ncbi:hypothetical protein BDW74DRAFT_152840 [Aspergillus multicolor]|uniref:uncharacterized protein n=1 Tax=Aspergillus multicolor TaxID=41759 RepID=UPI003CCE5218
MYRTFNQSFLVLLFSPIHLQPHLAGVPTHNAHLSPPHHILPNNRPLHKRQVPGVHEMDCPSSTGSPRSSRKSRVSPGLFY